jgi:hypothetical protein
MRKMWTHTHTRQSQRCKRDSSRYPHRYKMDKLHFLHKHAAFSKITQRLNSICSGFAGTHCTACPTEHIRLSAMYERTGVIWAGLCNTMYLCFYTTVDMHKQRRKCHIHYEGPKSGRGASHIEDWALGQAAIHDKQLRREGMSEILSDLASCVYITWGHSRDMWWRHSNYALRASATDTYYRWSTDPAHARNSSS